MRDSNSQPPGSEPGALPIEPIRIIWLWMRDSNPQNTGVKARCVTFSPIHNMYPVFMAAGSHMAESTVFETDPYTRAQRLAGVLQNPLDLLSMLKIKTRRLLPTGFYRNEVKMTSIRFGCIQNQRYHSRFTSTETEGSTKWRRQNDLLHNMLRLDCFCLIVRMSFISFLVYAYIISLIVLFVHSYFDFFEMNF